MKKILVFALLAIIPGIINAKTIKMDLSEAIKSNTVKADGINTEGGFIGKTTKLTITNNTQSTIEIKVNLGVILKPDNGNYQPMVLAGEEVVMVMPMSQSNVDVQTFCGNSPRSCPEANLHYTFYKQGSDTLVKILKFIKDNSLYDCLGQQAVWAFTNTHDIGNVYDSKRQELSKKIQDFLTVTIGKMKPQYYTEETFSQVPNQPAYVPKTMKIIANFEIALDSIKTLTLGIYNDSGAMVQKVFENQVFGKADHKTGHRFGVEFEAEGALQGKYYIRLKEGEMVLKEQMVKVD